MEVLPVNKESSPMPVRPPAKYDGPTRPPIVYSSSKLESSDPRTDKPHLLIF